ncbi:vacuolar protein sorting-associated protein vps13 [Pelomyxa schiedti]|nr:vacuolar protein sorting-associated protein vps13 [Pelomyxa schiedti]
MSCGTQCAGDNNYSAIIFSPDSNPTNLMIQVNSSKLSRSFGIDSVGLEQEVEVHAANLAYMIAISTCFGQNPFHRTKIVSFFPRIQLQNCLAHDLLFKQEDSVTAHEIRSSSREYLHWSERKKPRKLQISIPHLTPHWCTGFSCSLGRLYVQLFHPDTSSPSSKEFVVVQIAPLGSILSICFYPCTSPPYRLVNDTGFSIIVKQDIPISSEEILFPGSVYDFIWDDPTKDSRNVELRLKDGDSIIAFPHTVNLDNIDTTHILINLPDQEHLLLSASVSFDENGQTKTLRISKSTSSSEEMSPQLNEGIVLHFLLTLSRVGVSFVDNSPKELLYVSCSNLHTAVTQESQNRTIQLSLEALQIDNQLLNGNSCVALYQLSNNDNNREDTKKAFTLSLVQQLKYPNLLYITYLSALLQTTQIRVDYSLIYQLQSFITSSSSEDPKYSFHEVLESVNTKMANGTHNKKLVYIQLLHINPIKLNVSTTANAPSSIKKDELYQLLTVDNATITLNVLYQEHLFDEPECLLKTILHFYTTQLISQWYTTLLGLDCIGAPLSLWNYSGKGFHDFFYEPFLGLTKSPEDFAMGLSKGATSLVRNSVFGLVNSGSKLLGSLGNGIALLSCDEEFQSSRQSALREVPQHVGDGIVSGVRELTTGILHGVTGAITEPIKGIQQEGVGGLFLGLGRGALGLVLKPTVGLLDFAAYTAQGIKSTASYFGETPSRVRPPRFLVPNEVIRPYDNSMSQSKAIQSQITPNSAEELLCACQLSTTHSTAPYMLLVTRQNVLCVCLPNQEPPVLFWSFHFSEIDSVTSSGALLRLHIRGYRSPTTVELMCAAAAQSIAKVLDWLLPSHH